VADIQTRFFDFTRGADMALEGLLLAEDDELATAIIISLFTDAQARPDDAIPHNGTDRRGWWADVFADASGDAIGSRLWLLFPGKQVRENLVKARQFAEEALAWLVADEIAQRVVVEATNPRDGILALAVSVHKPDGSRLAYRFDSLWGAA